MYLKVQEVPKGLRGTQRSRIHHERDGGAGGAGGGGGGQARFLIGLIPIYLTL